VWELYNLTEDFTQMHNLADQEPERLEAMKLQFLEVAEDNLVFPIGAGIWLRLHPEDRLASPYTSWTFDSTTIRMPEFTAPGLGRTNNLVTITADLDENASGVLYALGGGSGGLTLYMDQGQINYEYNMMLIERFKAQTAKIPAGQHTIEIETILQSAAPLSPADVVIRVDGQEAARTTVGRTVPGAFTASETFDVGTDLGSPVSLDYEERRPFAFSGEIEAVTVVFGVHDDCARAVLSAVGVRVWRVTATKDCHCLAVTVGGSAAAARAAVDEVAVDAHYEGTALTIEGVALSPEGGACGVCGELGRIVHGGW